MKQLSIDFENPPQQVYNHKTPKLTHFEKLARQESELSRFETVKLNKAFDKRQQELRKYIPDDELQQEDGFDRHISLIEKSRNELLTEEDLHFLNSLWLPHGYKYNSNGYLIKYPIL